MLFALAFTSTAYGVLAFFSDGLNPLYLLYSALCAVCIIASRRYIWAGTQGSMAVLALSALTHLNPVWFRTITVFLMTFATLRGANVFGLALLGSLSSFASSVFAFGFQSTRNS